MTVSMHVENTCCKSDFPVCVFNVFSSVS